ncbi:hypothetical protein BDA99DRAFT_542971 [Phascolomyces articulosus]|uniref:Uncharacterized protein n=1 Tax=Phascolomyces articulosus TaxID=60185 RepID=A0AAD5JNB7_9FUNG|nr:hypothetical protein BDA99DRAFT_542971 [Phascolomyces articulosus]
MTTPVCLYFFINRVHPEDSACIPPSDPELLLHVDDHAGNFYDKASLTIYNKCSTMFIYFSCIFTFSTIRNIIVTATVIVSCPTDTFDIECQLSDFLQPFEASNYRPYIAPSSSSHSGNISPSFDKPHSSSTAVSSINVQRYSRYSNSLAEYQTTTPTACFSRKQFPPFRNTFFNITMTTLHEDRLEKYFQRCEETLKAANLYQFIHDNGAYIVTKSRNFGEPEQLKNDWRRFFINKANDLEVPEKQQVEHESHEESMQPLADERQDRWPSVLPSSVAEMRLDLDEGKVLVEKLKAIYDEGGMLGLQQFILIQNLELINKKKYDGTSVALKIFDALKFIIDDVQFGSKIEDPTKTESLTSWYHILENLFRNTKVELRIAETISESSKPERRDDDMAEGGSGKNKFGMKIDMLVSVKINNTVKVVELAANEFKRDSVPFETAELNKRFEVSELESYQLDPIVIDAIVLLICGCLLLIKRNTSQKWINVHVVIGMQRNVWDACHFWLFIFVMQKFLKLMLLVDRRFDSSRINYYQYEGNMDSQFHSGYFFPQMKQRPLLKFINIFAFSIFLQYHFDTWYDFAQVLLIWRNLALCSVQLLCWYRYYYYCFFLMKLEESSIV